MNIEQLFPKRWLSADDLAGRAVSVTIESVTLEQVRNPQRPWSRQHNWLKKLCCRRTKRGQQGR